MDEHTAPTRLTGRTGTYPEFTWAGVLVGYGIGILIALDATPQSDKNIGNDLCMHALFSKPLAIDRSSVPAEQVEKVRAEAIEIAKAEGKPEQIIDKIATGKVNAFFAERVLMEQLHVKTDDYGKKKVGDILKEAGVNAVTGMAIMAVGV